MNLKESNNKSWEIGDLVLKIITDIELKFHLEKPMPNLKGKCHCGFVGEFEYIGTQFDEKDKYACSLYNCPCGTTLSAETLLNNLYKTEVNYKK